MWCLRALLHPVWDMKAKALELYVILWLLACLAYSYMAVVPVMLVIFSPFATPLIPTTLGKIAYFAVSTSLVIGVSFYGTPYLVMTFILGPDYLLFSMYVWVAAFYATKVVPHHLLMIFFGLVNLVLSILYYRFRYDPTGTVKPLWAEKLG